MAKTLESKSESFLFRNLDSKILIRMASDRYFDGGKIRIAFPESTYAGLEREQGRIADPSPERLLVSFGDGVVMSAKASLELSC